MSVMTLKIIACISMLLDHIGFVFNIEILRIIGRIAFPIFLYLIYNGYKHTSNKLFYAIRLGAFAAISQVPFSLFTTGKIFCGNGNIFVTLFICLISIWVTDIMLRHRVAKWVSIMPTLAVLSTYYFGLIHSDYGEKAIILSFVFLVCSGKGLGKKILMVLGFLVAVYNRFLLQWAMLPFYWILGQNPGWPTLSSWEAVQIFSLLALPLIFLYNGKKGKWPIGNPKEKWVQYGFYLFYPAHLTLLWLVAVVIKALM